VLRARLSLPFALAHDLLFHAGRALAIQGISIAGKIEIWWGR
jgi:hypothetical protein